MINKKLIIKIDGMSCEHCSKKIQETIKKIENVKKVKVDLKNKEAHVVINNTNYEIIIDAINNLGYKVINTIFN